MPFVPKCLDVLANDRRPTLPAFRSAPLSPLSLAFDTPGVAVFLDVRHAVLERITALGAKEMAIVPVLAQTHDVLAKNRRLAMLASRSEELVPVKVAVEAQALIAIFSHGHAWSLVKNLPGSTTRDATKTFLTYILRFGTDLHGLQVGATSVTHQALRMEPICATSKCDKTAFNMETAFMAMSFALGGSPWCA